MLLAFTAFASGSNQVYSTAVSSGTVAPYESPETDAAVWTAVGTAPTIFGRAGGGIIGNYMYEFGSEANNVAQALNLTTGQWTTSTLATTGKDNWGFACTGTAIYLIGGYTGSAPINNTQKFVPTSGGPAGTWTQMAVYPQTVYGPCAAWDGGDYIYAVGGNNSGGTTLMNAYKYSISANTWTAIANAPVAFSFAGAAYVGGKLYVIGGTTAALLGTANYCYDPSTNTWTQKAAVPYAVWFATYSTTFSSTYMISCGGGGGYGSWPATAYVQIYDPSTNSWFQETALPVARGCNLACWAGNNTVYSGGGYSGGYSGVTYKGTNFFVVPDVEMIMTPSSTPIVIPAGGGSFQYTVGVHNNGAAVAPVQVWVMLTLPNGSSYGPVLGPVTANVAAGATVSRLRTQNIPASASAGSYSCVGNVGSYPGQVYDSANFPFTKSATGEGFYVDNFDNYGESFGEEIAAAFAAPSNFSLEAAYPNPFNPETNLVYNLAQAGNVKLAVYDIQGREVSVLLDGFHSEGAYNVSFNASHLSSGVYFAVLNANGQTFTQKLLLVK